MLSLCCRSHGGRAPARDGLARRYGDVQRPASLNSRGTPAKSRDGAPAMRSLDPELPFEGDHMNVR